MLKVRDLRIRDSENVTTFGGGNLPQLAKTLPEEERMPDACICLLSAFCA